MALPSRKIAGTMVSIALRPLMGDAAEGLGKAIKEGSPDSLSRLERLMVESQDRAWRALELGLRGPKWWEKAGSVISGDREMPRVHEQVASFVSEIDRLDSAAGSPWGDKFRSDCLSELLRARKGGIIPGEPIRASQFASESATFATASSADAVERPDFAGYKYLCVDLEQNGYQHLARYVEYSPSGDGPLLFVAVQHFFQKAVEADPLLLSLVQVQRLKRQETAMSTVLDSLSAGFGELGTQLTHVFDELSEKLDQIHEDVKGVGRGLDQLRIEEQERHERDVADRQLMMAMLQDMYKQIQQLTGGAAPQVNLTSEAVNEQTFEKVRHLADEALVLSGSAAGDNTGAATKLKELTRRFDNTHSRVFGKLHASAAARKPNAVAESSANATSVFKVARRGALKRSTMSAPVVEQVVRINADVDLTMFSILVLGDHGNVVRKLAFPRDGELSLKLRPGSYKLAIEGRDFATKDIVVSGEHRDVEVWQVG